MWHPEKKMTFEEALKEMERIIGNWNAMI